MSRIAIADELAAIYAQHGALDPEVGVEWARSNPSSALYSRLNWDDTSAAHQFRLIQMRNIITEVEVVYPDGKKRQVYVSPIEFRGAGGYVSLVDVLSNEEMRTRFLNQALADYERVGEKYRMIAELAGVRAEVHRAAAKTRAVSKGRAA